MNTLNRLATGLLLGSLSMAINAAPKDFGEGLPNLASPKMLINAQQQHAYWNGVGRIRNESKTLCTASLLDTRDESGKSGPAYVITSSHCLHRLNGSVQKDLPIKGHITFNYFDDTLEKIKSYPLKTLKWGSSQGRDLGIIELDTSLAALLQAGITPLKLAEETPADGSNILALFAPEWDTLQLSACTQQTSSELVEQPFVWRITLKNQCKGVSAGGFGGPLLDRQTNKLFGILSVTTAGRLEEHKCQRDAPCEIHGGIPSWHPDTNYASPVTFLNRCFQEGVLTADSEQCDLYPSTAIDFKSPEPIQQYFIKKTGKRGQDIIPRWNLSFTTNTPFYRYKTTRRAIECENPALYSAPFSAENAYINDPIGPQTGMHMLCILGVESAEQRSTNGMMTNAMTLAVELAEPGPARTPDMSISLDKDGLQSYTVAWNLSPPFMNRYAYKFGPAATTDCLRQVDYRPIPEPRDEDEDEPIELGHYPIIADAPAQHIEKFVKLISVGDRPFKVCTYAFDQADQSSTLRVDMLKPR